MLDAKETIKVWDPFVRIFHWFLVALFFLSYLTGESSMQLHEMSGYFIAILLVFRLAWGFVGPRFARFAHFVRSPRATFAYGVDMVRGVKQRYIGHNPLGAWGVFAMLLGLVATVTTGMMLLAVDEHEGPLAAWAAGLPVKHIMKGYHELCVNLMLALISLHLAGVAMHWFKFRENLVVAMFTGRKSKLPSAVDDE